MKQYNWHSKARTAGHGFVAVDKDKNIETFLADDGHAKCWQRLDETRERMPWTRSLVDSLKKHICKTGTLTEKQMSLATSLYIDCCIMTDDKIEAQQETRKLGYRLLHLLLGQMEDMVTSIMDNTSKRAFTVAQQRAFNNVAKRQIVELTKIPKHTDETFDGWFEIKPDVTVDI